jgi:DNA-binding transcriptional MerR regulator
MKKGNKSKKAGTKAKPKETKETNDDYYTEEEMKTLDKYHAKTNHKFDDEEIYELMQKYKDNEEAILNELNEELKEREKRGDEYEWHDVGKSN